MNVLDMDVSLDFPSDPLLRLLIFGTISDCDLSVLYLQEGIDQKL